MFRPYEGRVEVAVVGEAHRLWDGRNKQYDGDAEYQPAIASKLYLTAEEDNTGYIVLGGKHVDAALATRKGFPTLAPGQTFCWPMDNVDLRHIWVDVTAANDAVSFAYLAEPSPVFIP